MGITYSANLSNVQAIADEMGNIATYIQTMLTDLQTATTQLLPGWGTDDPSTASARQAYNTASGNWMQITGDMSNQAIAAQKALSSITDAYANAEVTNTNMWM